MKQSLFTIQSNEQLAEGVYKMVLAGDTSAITAPGQFVNIRLNSFFLRRPISVCDYGKNSLTIIYKTVGKGTEAIRAKGFKFCRIEHFFFPVETEDHNGALAFREQFFCQRIHRRHTGPGMGCSCQTKYGSKRICKDGPVLEKEEILW